AAAGRALVLEPSAQEFELLPEAELTDRPIGNGPLPVVVTASGSFELVVPLGPQLGQLALSAVLRETVGTSRSLGEAQLGSAAPSTDEAGRLAGPTYRAEGRISRPVRF